MTKYTVIWREKGVVKNMSEYTSIFSLGKCACGCDDILLIEESNTFKKVQTIHSFIETQVNNSKNKRIQITIKELEEEVSK